MRIQRNETIAGIPALAVRNFFRKVKEWASFTSDDMAQLSPSVAVVDSLVELGLIERTGDKYRLTQKGRALCLAKCIKPLDRPRADKIFNEFMQRVINLETDDEYLYRAKRILLFGSYINPEATDFGDIDIAVELESKFDKDLQMELNSEKVYEAKMSGHRFPTYLSELMYSYNLTLTYLKNRNRWISIHPVSDIENLDAPFTQVYPRT